MASFGKASLAARAELHPWLQATVDRAITKTDFNIDDATRGRAAQEKAFNAGNSKAHFGQSAHNYVPAVACDLMPYPFREDGWSIDKPAPRADFQRVIDAMFSSFAELQAEGVIPKVNPKTGRGVQLRSGSDWDMDGNHSDGWDWPHYELHPWRDYATTLTTR